MESADEFKDIQIISLFPKENSNEKRFVEFYQSDEILLDNRADYVSRDGILRIIGYDGGLGMPKDVAVAVVGDSFTDISGYLASPAYIQGMGSVNLIVDPALELIVRNADPSKVDGQMLDEDEDKLCDYSYGRDFSKIKRSVYNSLELKKPKLLINNSTRTRYAGFRSESEILEIPHILICQKERVVYVQKWSGVTNIYYHSDLEKVYLGDDKEALQAQLRKAIDEEKYEQAQALQKKLNKLLLAQNKPF